MALDDPMDKLEELEAVSGTKVLQLSCDADYVKYALRCSVVVEVLTGPLPHRASISGCRAASTVAAWGTALATAQSCRATTRRRSAGRKTTLVQAALAARCDATCTVHHSQIAVLCQTLPAVVVETACIKGCLTVSWSARQSIPKRLPKALEQISALNTAESLLSASLPHTCPA